MPKPKRRKAEPTDANRDGVDEKRLVGRNDKGQYDKRPRPLSKHK